MPSRKSIRKELAASIADLTELVGTEKDSAPSTLEETTKENAEAAPSVDGEQSSPAAPLHSGPESGIQAELRPEAGSTTKKGRVKEDEAALSEGDPERLPEHVQEQLTELREIAMELKEPAPGAASSTADGEEGLKSAPSEIVPESVPPRRVPYLDKPVWLDQGESATVPKDGIEQAVPQVDAAAPAGPAPVRHEQGALTPRNSPSVSDAGTGLPRLTAKQIRETQEDINLALQSLRESSLTPEPAQYSAESAEAEAEAEAEPETGTGEGTMEQATLTAGVGAIPDETSALVGPASEEGAERQPAAVSESEPEMETDIEAEAAAGPAMNPEEPPWSGEPDSSPGIEPAPPDTPLAQIPWSPAVAMAPAEDLRTSLSTEAVRPMPPPPPQPAPRRRWPLLVVLILLLLIVAGVGAFLLHGTPSTRHSGAASSFTVTSLYVTGIAPGAVAATATHLLPAGTSSVQVDGYFSHAAPAQTVTLSLDQLPGGASKILVQQLYILSPNAQGSGTMALALTPPKPLASGSYEIVASSGVTQLRSWQFSVS